MYRKSARRSSLFLLELMISILMFSVASAWCVRLFVTARSVVNETEEQNRAQNLAAGYAELFLASEDFEAFLLSEGAEKAVGILAGEGEMKEEGEGLYCFFYNENWELCGIGEGSLVLEIRITQEDDFTECNLWFHRPTEEYSAIYDLTVEKYTGGEGTL